MDNNSNIPGEEKTFESEKKYKFGRLTVNVKREYVGSRKIGEIISELILKSETEKINAK